MLVLLSCLIPIFRIAIALQRNISCSIKQYIAICSGQWMLCVPSCLTFKHTAFCTQSVCVVCTVIIINSISDWSFNGDILFIYCVGREFLLLFIWNSNFRGLMKLVYSGKCCSTLIWNLYFLPFSQDLTFKALLLSMEQVTKYGEMYRTAIVEFKIRHFEDRSKVMMGLIIFMFLCLSHFDHDKCHFDSVFLFLCGPNTYCHYCLKLHSIFVDCDISSLFISWTHLKSENRLILQHAAIILSVFIP